ncbi:putative ATP-dependent helicase [Trypanosoma cruzi]|uniref:Putative ATP-dependent helicase n=1 Tax=Trypanosoma cruzi TaxID=5693 RepID=A0A2V2XC59_TRYCR|nr:putative ATP-dependent helicase [Trypanosoma cruzi]
MLNSAAPPTALDDAWTDAKSASIDWTDPEDVLCNSWTFLRIMGFHPALSRYAESHLDEKERWQVIFMDPSRKEEQKDALQWWLQNNLLLLREERWCRHCGSQGHTRRGCDQLCVAAVKNGDTSETVFGHVKTEPSRIMSRFIAHQAEVERCKLLQEKQSKGFYSGISGRRNGAEETQQRRGDSNHLGHPRAKKELLLFAEERRRGVVGRFDANYGVGFIRVPEVGEVKFFLDRVDYGVKEISVGDAVTLKIDHSREYPFAVDIRPETPNITLEDVQKFLQRCRSTTQPINVIKTIMTHTHEWPVVLGLLRGMSAPAYIDAVHTLVELTTFVGNREPIHTPLLELFLSLMLRTPKRADVVPFFPTMLLDALVKSGELKLGDEMPMMVERWIEVVNLIVLLRHHTNVTTDLTGEVESALKSLLMASWNKATTAITTTTTATSVLAHTKTPGVSVGALAAAAKRKKIDGALQRLQCQQWEKVATLLIPTANDFSIPPPDPNSAFAPQNLPVNGATAYNSTETFITDQCRLLRADTFESVSRLLPAVNYELPHYKPTAETEAEIPYARIFDKVRFMGRVLTRDKDYASPDSYILHVQPKSPKAEVASQLLPGTTVCITTSLDRSVISPEEIFWGIITSCNVQFLVGGLIVLAPCESNAHFDILMERLKRNEKLGKTDHSCMLVTSVFMIGYKSIMKALSAFLGPLAMPLPLVSSLLIAEAASNATISAKENLRNPSDLVSYVPLHCESAFLEIIDSVNDRFALDEGQKEVMRRLPSSEVLLVQGPPGTGKSFIGCRVVEVYIRYKQLVASGDILRSIDVDLLRSTSAEDMLPNVGPIVIITYKNHALDEFLMDLLHSGLWDDERPRIAQKLIGGAFGGKSELFPLGKRIVRIGGRSREPMLDAYNLGSLMRTKADKARLNSLKERLFLMNQRLERLLKEIHFLESGRVPKSLFERWLTEEQRKSLRYEDREEWLQGKRYIGTSTRTAERTLYLDLLRTQLSACLDGVRKRPTVALEAPESVETDEDGGAPLSVFQEMKREEESPDFNDALPTTYLSAEAMDLAKNPPKCPEGIPEELLSLWSLDPVLRHEYYAFLFRDCISVKARDCQLIMDAIMNVVTIRNHAMDEVKLELLQGADVIGLTTTGCAKNQNLLRSLRPSVLVVEEAAEVLESQLLACMTDSLQQIVLIGDHYQLQPKVETFLYEKVNKLNMSLFERLAKRIRPICLTEQRRMHPFISRLVRPFYDTQTLLDSADLLTRTFTSAAGVKYLDAVPGLARRVFFWRHTHPEEEASGSRSKVNIKEVEMVLKIVAHLTSEGVHQKSITVITPYLGQRRLLRTSLRLRAFSDVAVSTVDLFQGDENDIVILSLVRTKRLTEFLRMRNRMIVSCSRARFAMVMTGSETLLEQSSHWKEVLYMLRKENCVGDRLPITYRSSPEEIVWMDA